jgi:flagellar biosynthesis protein FlhB
MFILLLDLARLFSMRLGLLSCLLLVAVEAVGLSAQPVEEAEVTSLSVKHISPLEQRQSQWALEGLVGFLRQTIKVCLEITVSALAWGITMRLEVEADQTLQ